MTTEVKQASPEAKTVSVRCLVHHFKLKDGTRFYKDDVKEISEDLAEELIEEGKVENV